MKPKKAEKKEMVALAKEALNEAPKAADPRPGRPLEAVLAEYEAELAARRKQLPELEAAIDGTKARIQFLVGATTAYRSVMPAKKKG